MDWYEERRAALRRIVGLAILIRLEVQRLRQVEGKLGAQPAGIAEAEQVCLAEETTWTWASMDVAADVLRAALYNETETAPEEER